MNKMILSLAVIMGLLCLTSSVFAAGDANADASAKIQKAIAVVKDTGALNGGDLAFGVIVPGTATVVTVGTNNARTKDTGTATLLGTAFGAASFNVTGSPDATYTVTKPAAAITITNGTETMSVDGWTCTASGTQTLSSDNTGLGSFKIGGDLHVGAAQAVGQYTGVFTVTVAYN
jgi:hypothetical protein